MGLATPFNQTLDLHNALPDVNPVDQQAEQNIENDQEQLAG